MIGNILIWLGRNWKTIVAVITAIGVLVAWKKYETKKAKEFEEQLQKLQEQYRKGEFKVAQEAGKNIFRIIQDSIGANTVETPKEKEELSDILSRHRKWIYA